MSVNLPAKKIFFHSYPKSIPTASNQELYLIFKGDRISNGDWQNNGSRVPSMLAHEGEQNSPELFQWRVGAETHCREFIENFKIEPTTGSRGLVRSQRQFLVLF